MVFCENHVYSNHVFTWPGRGSCDPLLCDQESVHIHVCMITRVIVNIRINITRVLVTTVCVYIYIYIYIYVYIYTCVYIHIYIYIYIYIYTHVYINNDNYNNKTQLIRIGNASREKPCVTTTQNRHESTDYPRYCPNP